MYTDHHIGQFRINKILILLIVLRFFGSFGIRTSWEKAMQFDYRTPAFAS